MFRSLFKGGKKFSVVTFCNLGVQITSLFFFTIIARLFEPEILGEYLIYLAYVSIIVILSTGFYEQALFIDTTDRRQGYIVVTVLTVALGSSFCAYVPMSIFSPDYAVFVCLSVLAGAMRVIARSYGIVNGRLIHIAIYDLVSSPILPLSLVFGAKYFEQYTSLYLIYANSLVTFITSFLLLVYVVSLNRFKLVYTLKHGLHLSILILRRYINLPKYKMTAELVGILTLRLPLFAMDRFFSANIAAFYGVAFRIAIVPVSVITSTVAQMFLYKIRYNRANSVSTYNVFIKYSLLLLGISILSIVTIFTLADWLIVQLFTAKYSEVSHILKLLSPYIAVLILVSPLMGTFVVYEKQRYLLVMKLLLLVMTAVGYMLAVLMDDIDYGFIIFSLSSILVYGYAYLLIYKHYKNETSNGSHSMKE
jgi:O-antigen/teichoic acid export membrane protein